jgi:hypothetical protein
VVALRKEGKYGKRRIRTQVENGELIKDILEEGG